MKAVLLPIRTLRKNGICIRNFNKKLILRTIRLGGISTRNWLGRMEGMLGIIVDSILRRILGVWSLFRRGGWLNRRRKINNNKNKMIRKKSKLLFIYLLLFIIVYFYDN